MRSAGVMLLLVLMSCQGDRSDDRRREPLAIDPQLSGRMPRSMRNCPSAVATAKTVAAPTSDGVEVTITSDDAAARSQIVARARMHSAFGEPLTAFPIHSGMHAGPGSVGRCPIIHTRTIVTHDEIARGVRIHVRAVVPSMVARLQQVTQLRVRALSPASS